MATFQNQNQFSQTPLLGQVDMTVGSTIITGKIDPASEATKLQAGQVMKLVDVAGSEIIVDVCTDSIDDLPFGVIPYNPRKSLYAAGDTVELALRGTVIYLEPSAAVARGAFVTNDPAGPTVATQGFDTPQLGIMLDKPTAAGRLSRVMIEPAFGTPEPEPEPS